MANKLIVEKIQLKTLQRYYHQFLNNFGEQETLIEAISNRPGFFAANPIAFLSIMARRPTLEAKDLEEALLIDRTLIRASAFRGGLYLIPTEDYPTYFRAFFQYLDIRKWEKLESYGYSRQKLSRIKDILFKKTLPWPLSSQKIIEAIFPLPSERPEEEVWYLILQKLCDLGLLVRASSKGWKGNNFTYAPMEKWVPEIFLKSDNTEAARSDTIRKYLRAYGPASIEDIIWWSGLTLAQCQRALTNLKKEIMRFNVENHRNDMYALKESLDNIRKKNLFSDDIQFLPPWDPYTLGWHCATRLSDKEFLPFIFDAKQNSTSVIIDQGKVIGLWQLRDEEINILEYHIFQPYLERKKAVLQKIDEWSNKLMKLTGADTVYVFEKNLSAPLTKRPLGSLLWPLGKDNPVKNTSQTISFIDNPKANTFREPYLDNRFLVRPSGPIETN